MDCRAVAVKKWGNQSPILPKVIDIESEHEKHPDDREYILIGTLYKDMSLRGSVRRCDQLSLCCPK
jgi:hypothetical protein